MKCSGESSDQIGRDSSVPQLSPDFSRIQLADRANEPAKPLEKQEARLKSMSNVQLESIRDQAREKCAEQGMPINADWFKNQVYPQWAQKKLDEQVQELHQWSTQDRINYACRIFANQLLKQINPENWR